MKFEYASPIDVSDASECFFYHSMSLPDFGEIKGHWDLRDVVGSYLGNADFSGKRVLDVGAASGYLTFEIERRGGQVVSFDLDDGANWDVVPHYKLRDQLPDIRNAQSETLIKLKNAYWLSHRSYRSKAKAFYGNIYDIPYDIGNFDIVFYGMIVGHLRDVFNALYNGAKLCSDTIIVTSIFPETENPSPIFQPRADNPSNYAIKSWWGLNVGTIRAMLGVLGFEIVDLVRSDALCIAPGFEGRHKCTAIVARRVAE